MTTLGSFMPHQRNAQSQTSGRRPGQSVAEFRQGRAGQIDERADPERQIAPVGINDEDIGLFVAVFVQQGHQPAGRQFILDIPGRLQGYAGTGQNPFLGHLAAVAGQCDGDPHRLHHTIYLEHPVIDEAAVADENEPRMIVEILRFLWAPVFFRYPGEAHTTRRDCSSRRVM